MLELSLDIGGLPVLVADTAGLREETADEVEKIGIERARKACVLLLCDQPPPFLSNSVCMFVHICPYSVQAADASLLVLACPDAVTSATTPPSGPRLELEIPVELAPLVNRHTFILLNKTDLLPPASALAPAALAAALPQRGWAVSLASHAGTEEFLAGLARALQDRCGGFLLSYSTRP